MPALLERPKLSSAMARALHRHVMVERERKRQAGSVSTRGPLHQPGSPPPGAGGGRPDPGCVPAEEEEVDKMMEQKMRDEQERRRKKEMEERMSLEETKEQISKLGERLQALQEEKHQLFLQLKKVLHEEEKRRRKEQSDLTTLTAAPYQQGMVAHAGTHILNMQGSPGGHSRAGTLISADRSKQIFAPPVITPRHFATQPAFAPGTPEHGQYQSGQAGPSPYAVGQAQHFAPGQAGPSATPAASPSAAPRPSPPCSTCRSSRRGTRFTDTSPPAQPGFIPPQHNHPPAETTGTCQPAVRLHRLVNPAPDAPQGPAPQPDPAAQPPAPCPDAAGQQVGLPRQRPAGLSSPLHPGPALLPQVSPRPARGAPSSGEGPVPTRPPAQVPSPL
ncbi:G protein pathway suppressor 2 isoform X2 [Lepidochelys kempii]|uniref:G protein pathway suppressor 2 isoform X2 n=1 Tax=Lepidochelys kempii TaxID=8472 RepID=UPI003C6ED8EF